MINDILNEADSKMDKSVEATREEFAAIRAGRANPSMFSKIMVDYYGTPDADPAARVVHRPRGPDHPGRAVRHGRDGQHRAGHPRLRPRREPANDGKVLRCVFPELTEERRKEYIKVARHQGRGRPGRRPQPAAHTPSRSWRSSRRTARSARTTSPAPRSGSTAMTKKHTDAIDELLKHKEAELLEV